MAIAEAKTTSDPAAARSFLLQRVQPAMTGVDRRLALDAGADIRGPLATHRPNYACLAGLGTFLGGIVHTLPFLIPASGVAVAAAVVVIALELVTLALIRWRYFQTGFLCSFASVTLGGAIIAGLSAVLGGAAG
jgi:hypothetical protein